jgi:protein O-mannosyl-transferase
VATFRINYLLCGHSPFGYHLVNIMLHSIVTGLFVYVVQTTLCVVDRCASTDDGSQYDVNANAEGRRSAVAILAGLLFAVHPIHTEAVAGIVGRADVLACLFFLLSFRSYAIYCHFRDQPFSDLYEKCTLEAAV